MLLLFDSSHAIVRFGSKVKSCIIKIELEFSQILKIVGSIPKGFAITYSVFRS